MTTAVVEAEKVNWADSPMDTADKPLWADEVAEDEDVLPDSTCEIDGDKKVVTEYKINDKGQKVKVIRTFRIVRRKTSKSVAKRKVWKKFGLSENDQSGPVKATTIISETVNFTFVNSRDEEINEQEDPMISKFKNQLQYFLFFNNFTKKDNKDREDAADKKDDSPDAPGAGDSGTASKYVPPSQRVGATGRGAAMPTARGSRDEQATIRVTNLSEETKEQDLQDLFRPCGPIQRIFLAKDKHTQQSKGFAFINFYKREDAAKAIKSISGFGYDHLILNVEWAKPSTNTT